MMLTFMRIAEEINAIEVERDFTMGQYW